MALRRVVVTGIGANTPLGNSFHSSWEALLAATSGIAGITRFDASSLPWRVAGELRDFDAEAHLSPRETNRLDPFVHYAVAASVMAAEDAGLINSEVPELKRTRPGMVNSPLSTPHASLLAGGVIIGSSRGGITSIERALLRSANRSTRNYGKGTAVRAWKRSSPYLMPATTISMAASSVAQKLGMKGSCLGISNACASGANAIGEAFRLIKSGCAEVVLAGGTEAPICSLCVEGYGSSGALSRTPDSRASRPFDRRRDGFVLSEGACMLVLEEYQSALRRGADIYGELDGYGNTADAYHMTRPDPEGEARAISLALREGGAGPEDIDYINTHGTSTPLGDVAEAEALKIVFGKGVSDIPASALKSMTGHMLAASGAFEVASTLMSMKEGTVPPTINLTEKDPACDINIVTEKCTEKIDCAISNSFGFGGVNAVILLRSI